MKNKVKILALGNLIKDTLFLALTVFSYSIVVKKLYDNSYNKAKT